MKHDFDPRDIPADQPADTSTTDSSAPRPQSDEEPSGEEPSGDKAGRRAPTVRALTERALDVVPDLVAASVDTDEEAQYERSPAAVLRLVAAGIAMLLVELLSKLTPRAIAGLQQDLQVKAGTWAINLGSLAQAIATGIALLTVMVIVAAASFTRLWRQLATVLLAGAFAASGILAAASYAHTTAGLTATEYQLGLAAATIAMAASSLTLIKGPMARWPVAAIVVFTMIGVLGAEVSLVARILVLLFGEAIGSLVAVIGGTASRQITRTELAAGLVRAGLPVGELSRHGGDARGSQPWTGTLATGSEVFIKVEAMDERRADQLFRMWRRIRLKDPEDERGPSSIRRSAEHEAFVAQRAQTVGVRTPSVLGLGVLEEDRGVFTVFETVQGKTFDEFTELSDTALRSAWAQVSVLRRAKIAHRDLRTANLMCHDDDAWIIDFGFSEIAASDALLARDMAELLASSAALVGVRRAVDTAAVVLGQDTIAESIPWLQPLAVCAATRSALSKTEFADLRERVRALSGISAPEVPQLQRVTWKALAVTAALGVAIWSLLPQLTSGIDWASALRAQKGWIAAALLASVGTYMGAAVSMRGSVSEKVPIIKTFFAQLGSSFTNRIMPAKVGGVALNARYLTKQGVDAASAAAGVGVSTAAGTVVHISITLVIVIWAGNVGLPKVSAPPVWVVAIIAVSLVGTIVAAVTVPPLRSWCERRIVPPMKRAYQSLIELMHSPTRLAMVFGGSAAVTICNLLAFVFSLRAFGISVPFTTAGVVYLAGQAIASAAPTPGGLGATEAALVGGLSVVDVAQNEAIPAVLLFRMATFWIPILPGWISLTALQRRGDI